MIDSCVCLDIDEEATIHRSSIRKAHKQHKCCECGERIQPNQKYEYVTGLWDGQWSTFKTCSVCLAIRNDFMSCGWEYGNLWQHLKEYLTEDDDFDDEGNSWLFKRKED